MRNFNLEKRVNLPFDDAIGDSGMSEEQGRRNRVTYERNSRELQLLGVGSSFPTGHMQWCPETLSWLLLCSQGLDLVFVFELTLWINCFMSEDPATFGEFYHCAILSSLQWNDWKWIWLHLSLVFLRLSLFLVPRVMWARVEYISVGTRQQVRTVRWFFVRTGSILLVLHPHRFLDIMIVVLRKEAVLNSSRHGRIERHSRRGQVYMNVGMLLQWRVFSVAPKKSAFSLCWPIRRKPADTLHLALVFLVSSSPFIRKLNCDPLTRCVSHSHSHLHSHHHVHRINCSCSSHRQGNYRFSLCLSRSPSSSFSRSVQVSF